MDALTVLTERVSAPQLTGPGPSESQIGQILQAALRAPDHAWMRPWRYLTIQGDAQKIKLGELFLRAVLSDDPTISEERQQKTRNMPWRAPLLIVAIANVQDHPKVPEIEQLLSTGAGIQNILNAAYAMGLGAIWRTGEMAYHPLVKQGLGLSQDEHIVGFVYVGHVNCKLKQPPQLEIADFVQSWQG